MLKSFIIIPCYNPTKKLVAVITKIQKRFKGIIILIDDGNFIKNKKYIYSIYKRKNLKIISHKSNMGKGAAIKSALKYILKNYKNFEGCVVVDADGQHHQNDIFNILKYLKKFQYKKNLFIMGCRKINKNLPFKSYIGNKISIIIYNYLLNFKFYDTQTGLRAYNKKFVIESLNIKQNRFDFETQQLITAREKNYEIIQIPIKTIYFKNNKNTSFNPFLDSWKIYLLIFKQFLSTFLISIFDFIIFYKIIFEDNVIESNLIARSTVLIFQFYLLKNFIYQKYNTYFGTFLFFTSYVFLSGYISGIIQINLSELCELNKYTSKITTEMFLFLINFALIKNIMFLNKNDKHI